MKNKKVTIFFPFIEDGPSGGGNNFLKALRSKFKEMKVWVDSVEEADTVFFNSHQTILEVAHLKDRYQEKVFIHRVDGPMSIYNGPNDRRDLEVRLLNFRVADGTIYQSNWSKEKNEELGLKGTKKSTTIWNAPDPTVFFSESDNRSIKGKLKIITTGWSTNPNKGTDALVWLDDNLDFSQFQVDSIGPLSRDFKNITSLGTISPEKIGSILREYDVFFFPSIYEACSNSLLEGIHSGLVPLARKSSSNIELVKREECLFDSVDILQEKLAIIRDNFEEFRSSIELLSIDEVAGRYYEFGTSIDVSSVNSFSYLKFLFSYYLIKLKKILPF